MLVESLVDINGSLILYLRVMGQAYHEAQIAPLVQKVPVDIDTVGLRQVLGDQLPDSGEVRGFLLGAIRDVAELIVGLYCWW